MAFNASDAAAADFSHSQPKYKLIWSQREHVAALAQNVHMSSNICLEKLAAPEIHPAFRLSSDSCY